MLNFIRLRELSQTDPAIVQTKDDLFTLKVGENWAHSLYSPAKEAQRLVENMLTLDHTRTLIVLFGAGLGYHLDLLEREGFQNIIVIEKDPAVYTRFQKVYDLNPNYFLLTPEDYPDKLDKIFALLEIQNIRNIKTVVLRGTYKKELYESFEERLERLLKVKLGDFSTRMKFEELWFINILKNIPNLKTTSLASSLLYKNHNVPVLIISAGPSLRQSLTAIKKLLPYCFTIAVDTALLPLYEAGITPDFIYSLDSQVHNLNDFALIDRSYLAETHLIYDMVVNPYLADYFRQCRGKASGPSDFMVNTAHLEFDYNGNSFLIKNELVNWLETTGGFRLGDVETGGSVATSAFHFAYLFGGSPIILTGQDLAYSFLTSHSPSSSHYYRIQRSNNRVKPLQSTFMQILRARRFFKTEPLYQNDPRTIDVYTDFVLNNFKGWFEESAHNIKSFQPGIKLINSTMAGQSINQFEKTSLEEVHRQFCKNNVPVIDKKNYLRFPLIDSGKISKIIQRLNLFKDFITMLPADSTIFNSIEGSEWGFAQRYFMREKLLFTRYGNLDQENLERKVYRLVKNIEGLSHV